MKNRISVFHTVMQLALILAAGALVIFASMGLRFNPEKLGELDFWQNVMLKMIAVIAIFNAIFSIYSSLLRQTSDSKYYDVMATNRIRIDEIYKRKLFAELDAAIAEENKDALIAECNEILRRTTSRLSYNDLDLDNLDIPALCGKYLLNRRQSRRLRRAVMKIANGKVRHEAMKADHILKDKDGDKDKPISATYDLRRFLLRQNILKGAQFIVASVIFAALSFGQVDMTFWQALLTNGILFINAMVSGISFAYSYIKTRTAVFEQRNRFLDRRMGITTVYIPAAPASKKLKPE